MNIKRYSDAILALGFYSIIASGIFFALYQVFNRSLWNDESALALNIINKGFIELLKPLEHGQVAPIGFLFIEKLSTLALGRNDVALRVPPVVCFLASIPLYYGCVNRLSQNKQLALFGAGLFSISNFLLRYSSEVKQYSADLLCALMLMYFCLPLQKNKNLFLCAFAGSMAVWFSNISVVLLCTLGMYLLYAEVYIHKNVKSLFVFVSWAVSFSMYYIYFIYDHPLREYMQTYWQEAFLPLSPLSLDFYIFLIKAGREVLDLLGFGPFWFFPCLIVCFAIGGLIQDRKYRLLYLCLFPIFLHLLLSGLRLYPFASRFLLYATPLVIFLFSFGIYELLVLTQKRAPFLPQVVLLIPALAMFYPVYLDYPRKIEEIKNSLIYMETNLSQGDLIYVYEGAITSFEYYQETEFADQFVGHTIIMGTAAKLPQEILDLQGKVWLIFSHVKDPDLENSVLNRLSANGAVLLLADKYVGSSVYYIDMRK
jgi:hypothetical protein